MFSDNCHILTWGRNLWRRSTEFENVPHFRIHNIHKDLQNRSLAHYFVTLHLVVRQFQNLINLIIEDSLQLY